MTMGFDPQAGSQAEFAAYLKSEIAKWAQVIKTTGITPN
jgi:tripartite-type tricarboxylate transporter receptor subunit TctC